MEIRDLEIEDNHGWKGLVTIDDLWNTLLTNGTITLAERIRVKELSHEDQQIELEKYERTE